MDHPLTWNRKDKLSARCLISWLTKLSDLKINSLKQGKSLVLISNNNGVSLDARNLAVQSLGALDITRMKKFLVQDRLQ